MVDEPLQPGRSQWLWILIFAGMALLIVIWLIDTWEVESEVKPGASAEGLTYPAGGGITIDAPETPAAAPAEEAAPPPADAKE